jgi:Flp pilus assembly protein TadG
MGSLLALTTPVMRVGYALIVAAVVPLLMSWILALVGLGKVSAAAKDAEKVAKDASQAVANAQTLTAAATGTEAHELASANAQVATQTSAVTDAITDVRDAMAQLTGVFAPTRAFLALALLLVTAGLVKLGVISIG